MGDSGQLDFAVFKDGTDNLADRALEAIRQWG
jgi:hypothetical protein